MNYGRGMKRPSHVHVVWALGSIKPKAGPIHTFFVDILGPGFICFGLSLELISDYLEY